MVKDLLFSKEGEQEKPLLGFAKMTGSQLADKARQLQIPVSENHTRGHLINIIKEDCMQQPTPKGSDYQGYGKHGAKTYQEVPQVDHEYCRWIDQVEDQQFDWKLEVLFVVEDAKRLPGTNSGKQYDPGTCDKTHQAAPGGRALRRNASVERTRRTPQDTRTERSQLNDSLGGGKPLVEGTSSEVDGTSSVADDVFARAWAASSAESSAEWQKLAERTQW